MDEDGSHTNNIGRLSNSSKCVAKKCFANTFSLFALVHGQASEQNHPNRVIGDSLSDSLRSLVLLNGACDEGVVADYAGAATGDVCLCRLCPLIGPGEAL